ncbi:PHD finger protein 3 [Morella rubra]|uniref:PHD finger protein 3 n=1 Tax=Morella rubra TaxID=262757 RepID=A0A6A1UVS0_9ROSI|nr:PHD finger protein 3 [Morella rubra]
MSNNLVSQHLSIPSVQIGQLEPVLNNMESSVQDRQMGLMGSVSNGTATHQYSISNKQVELLEPFSIDPGLQRLSTANIQTVGIEHNGNRMGLQQFIPNRQLEPMETMLNDAGSQQLSPSIKRKAAAEPLYDNTAAQQLLFPNKRVAQLEHRPWLQPVSGPYRKPAQVQYMSSTPGSLHSSTQHKKVVSSKSGSQRSSIPKNQTAGLQPSPKGHTESFESVRSKMRESLAGALELVSQLKDKSSSPEKNSQSDSASASGQIQENAQPAESVSTALDAPGNESGEPKVTLLSHEACSAHISNNGNSGSARILADGKTGESPQTQKSDGQETQSNYVLPGEDVSFGDDFFAKDELLQGNGLSWILDSDMQVVGKREFHTAEEQKSGHYELVRQKEESIQTPQMVAFKIEAELFKLFGGVNKKYKEKGRSLLFNLKDRNNPELRERVMSGDIPPERLCAMTAEELASEELSQWRIAKAEEFAQMVVLPDEDVDIRRLVKKTHKGDIQVEVEQDESVPMEVVSVRASSLTPRESNIKEMEASHPSKPDRTKNKVDASGERSNSDDQENPYEFTIPSSEGNDLMQGLMVDDDALKDAEFLPPIVSLDEFMESLNAEPPFENLPVDAGKVTPFSDKDDSELGSESKTSNVASKAIDVTTDKTETVDVTNSKSDVDQKSNEGDAKAKLTEGDDDMKTSDYQADKNYNSEESVVKHDTEADVNSNVTHPEVKSTESSADFRSSDRHAKSEIVSPSGISNSDHVWEGLLQLNTSAMASVAGIFKSGERTSAKEWSTSLEIKGRVRLDAFEKFLQELPLSRSRAVMVMHFVLVEGSVESEDASLHEVADSYVLDERVGFAEPSPGVELYFCPPHKRTREMLSKILPTEHIEALNNIDNGLIGVIVWRKAQLTSRISPNSSSHQKHKKQNVTSRRQQETNMNANFTPKQNPSRGLTPSNFKPSPDDEDDDIPPGFGPPAARDEDDLPEFNFSGGSVPSSQHNFVQNPYRGLGNQSVSQNSSRPVDQMRELVHKYGQPGAGGSFGNWQENRGFGVAVQPWNEDDDDIPEWQPQAPQRQLPPQQSVHSFHQPVLRPHLVNQPPFVSAPQQPSHQSMMALQSPLSLTQAPQGTWWVPPVQANSQQSSNLGCQPNVGQFSGVPGRGVGQPGAAWRQNAPNNGGF